MTLPTVSEARKAIVATLGLLAELASLGLLHGTAAQVVQAVVGAAVAAGVYVVPNAPKVTP